MKLIFVIAMLIATTICCAEVDPRMLVGLFNTEEMYGKKINRKSYVAAFKKERRLSQLPAPIKFEVWATRDYAKKNERIFTQYLREFNHALEKCNENSEEILDECKELRQQGKIVGPLEEELVKDVSLHGCRMSYDQLEITCPTGLYVKKRSITDIARGAKPKPARDSDQKNPIVAPR